MSLLTRKTSCPSVCGDSCCRLLFVSNCTAFVASSSKCFVHPFLFVNRSHVLWKNPSDPKAARQPAPRGCVSDQFLSRLHCSLLFRHFCASQRSQQFLQKLIVCGLPSSSTTTAAISKNFTLGVSRQPAESLTPVGTKPSSPQLMLLSIYLHLLAGHVILRLRRFSPCCCFSFSARLQPLLTDLWSTNVSSQLTSPV